MWALTHIYRLPINNHQNPPFHICIWLLGKHAYSLIGRWVVAGGYLMPSGERCLSAATSIFRSTTFTWRTSSLFPVCISLFTVTVLLVITVNYPVISDSSKLEKDGDCLSIFFLRHHTAQISSKHRPNGGFVLEPVLCQLLVALTGEYKNNGESGLICTVRLQSNQTLVMKHSS